ncbi:MAG: hypothetical protein ACI3WQ_09260 [Faecousia sp.]
MSFEIYPQDLSTRYELSHATSAIITIYYNAIGKLILVAPVNDYNIAAIKDGYMLYDTERDVTFDLVNVKNDTGTSKITANGYTTNWRLNRRCITSKCRVTTLESGVYTLVNSNLRNLPGVATAPVVGLTERTDNIFYGGQLLDEVMPFLSEAGLGNKMVWDPDTLTHTFHVYKGRDLTEGIHAVVFSEEQGSAQDLIINDDDSTFKNFAYVTGTLRDGTEFVETVGATDAEDLREIWMDTSIYQETDETEAECRSRARAYGTMELGKRIRRKSFSVTIDPEELGRLYALGDIVSCASVRFGTAFNARIEGIKYSIDNKKAKTEVILGDPILTALGELKLNGRN